MLNTVQIPPDNSNKPTLSRRTPWVDVVKGIGIFYVTFAHLNPNLSIETHIYSFHMFLFFAISGFLEKKEPEAFAVFFKKKFVRLFIPFMFWNTLSIIAGVLLVIIHLKNV